MRTAFKCRAYPTPEQAANLSRTFGCARKVWNETLAWRHARYYRDGLSTNVPEANAHLTTMKRTEEFAYLSEVSSVPLQQVLRTQQKAFANFFAKRADFPRFKKKGQSDSFRYPDPKQIKLDQTNSRIFLPKLGWLRYRNSRKVLGEVKNVTVSQSCGKWSVSIQTEREVEQLAVKLLPADLGALVLLEVLDEAVG